ncbi:hypothetical protein BDB00DRAFT_222255 [Zychaea mexicana]|uniref:uncharacterized protein n=1 Tax=Zychaea mexicana TaxID=64656 RepID=UPI0022FEB45F|nr:uncharacterized protein BDB00DRAFT_222255 [Zychaea mexicana]KAI9499188.1 hypothetical protein BDB00DRAFT_222255 [Zychaea mexicana]
MNLRRRTPKELILMAQEAQRVLLYVLEYFGPDPFESVWKNFKPMYFGQFKDRRINRPALELENDDDDDDEPYECSLTEFDDLWDLAAYCFGYVEPRHRNNKQQDQQSLKQPAGHMRRRMVLNVIITVLEADLRDRRGSNSALEKCEFLNTLRKDSTGNRSQFDRYLDIIFCAFGCHSSEDGEPTRLKDAEAAEFAGRLLNMMGVLSYCDNLVTTSALVEQTYRRFLKLDVESCANLIQIIESTTFLSALCDLYLSDSDCSCVPEEYMKLRKGRHTTFLVEKLLHFNIKTRPVKLESLEDIYRHVMIVLWRYMLYFNERSLRYDVSRTKQDGSRTFHSRTISTVTDDQKIEVIVSGPDAIAQWRKHVDSMIKEVGGDSLSGENDRKLKKQIKWSIQLLQLYM